MLNYAELWPRLRPNFLGPGETVRGRTVCANAALQIRNLSKCWVLSACSQKIAERAAVNSAVAALVEELESFAVVCGGLVAVIHCCPVLCIAGAFAESQNW